MSPEKYPNIAAVAAHLNAHERKYNRPLEKVWVSFDARDELVKWLVEERRFVNTVQGPNGSRGVEYNGTAVFPFNQLSGGQICIAID